eukprot:TRINITY_DN36867_c0_g1_i1.p1 TRINITY_DN36867_c0_g1~~TRINITY_DN36867_c0_g1_i1.p1  ORF type:complete len:141 (+),score=20.11 TRINITY_DN36867_c0_g1_i1:32-424(+)
MVARKKTGNATKIVNGFFFNGFQTNIDLLPKYYPGWVVRIYHDIEESDPLTEMFCEFSCKYDYVDMCNARFLPGSILKNPKEYFHQYGDFSQLLILKLIFSYQGTWIVDLVQERKLQYLSGWSLGGLYMQ